MHNPFIRYSYGVTIRDYISLLMLYRMSQSATPFSASLSVYEHGTEYHLCGDSRCRCFYSALYYSSPVRVSFYLRSVQLVPCGGPPAPAGKSVAYPRLLRQCDQSECSCAPPASWRGGEAGCALGGSGGPGVGGGVLDPGGVDVGAGGVVQLVPVVLSLIRSADLPDQVPAASSIPAPVSVLAGVVQASHPP